MDDLWVRLDLGVGGLGLIRARFVFVVTELFVCIQFLILITISGFDWNCLWSPNSSSQLLNLILISGFHFPHQLPGSFMGLIGFGCGCGWFGFDWGSVCVCGC